MKSLSVIHLLKAKEGDGMTPNMYPISLHLFPLAFRDSSLTSANMPICYAVSHLGRNSVGGSSD